MHRKVLVIDNYDSFVYNLVQYLGEMGCETLVFRNDEISLKQAKELKPTHILISPGPGHPKDAKLSLEIIRDMSQSIPTLGVCLGHQAIGYVFGGNVVRADRIMHGKTSRIYHDGKGIYEGIQNPFEATRYHSLVIEEKTLPKELIITAQTREGEIMGVRHRKFPIEGVQFHPESILTTCGKDIIRNFIR